MKQEEINKSLQYYERLLEESMNGNSDSLKELKSMAGAGEAAAQYHLALYYEQTSKTTLEDNENYVWWISKAANANYLDSNSRFKAVIPSPKQTQRRNVQPFFLHVFSPEGRISRTEYITILLILNVIYLILYGIFQANSSETPVVLRLIQLPLAYFALMAGAKRCHDTGVSGLRFLIPFYGLYLLIARGDLGKNEYGPDPRGEEIQSNNRNVDN